MTTRVDVRTIISWAFIALAIASGVFIVTASLNYNQLYPALSQLDVGISRISFGNQIDATIFVNNPVNYRGLGVTGASLSVHFSSGNDLLFNNSAIYDTTNVKMPVAPDGNTTWDWTITISMNQSSALASFISTHNSVTAHYFLTVSVASFLQAQVGASPFQKEAELPLR